jgi:phenylacetate-coenzyme A ligase PaaK-like adenylate-forming protein
MTAVTAAAPSGADALRAHAVELLERDRWPRERLVALQQRRLQDLLAHAVLYSPYYRKALGPAAAASELAQLPTCRSSC